MTTDYRYLNNEAWYLPVAEFALKSQFNLPQEFETFYAGISTLERKNQFLRAASFYYYMIKQGDWVVTAPDCNSIIGYFTDSYKAVGLFAIIESLSKESHQDFYSWLLAKPEAVFPALDRTALKVLHEEYKSTYGSIRRCVGFFSRLSTSKQAELCNAVNVEHQSMPSIKKLAEFLYNIRSKFVHEAEVALPFSGPTHHFGHKNALHTNLTMPVLFSAFEEGLVAYFRDA